MSAAAARARAISSVPRPARARSRCARLNRERGFSYVEVIAAALLVAICLPAALEALSLATRGVAEQEAGLALRYRLRGAMEEVLTQTPAALDAAAVAAGGPAVPSSFSDPAGTPNRRLVYLARYDFDNADGDGNRLTGGDAGLVWVQVAIEGRAAPTLATLVAP